MVYRTNIWLPVSCIFVGALFVGCGGDSIKTYRVPKEAASRESSINANPHQGAEGLHWIIPETWTESQGSSMRLGSYATPEGGDASVISLPDSPDLANVNRWLGQINRPPVIEAQLAEFRTGLSTDLGPVPRFFLKGEQPNDRSILAAILRTSGNTFFFKLDGPRQVLEEEASAFDQWVASVHPAHHSSPAQVAVQETPEANLLVNQQSVDPKSSGSMQMLPGMQESLDAIPDASWSAPENWESTMPRPGRKGSFSIAVPGFTQPVDFSITALGGTAGGMTANVNRWQGQIGAPSLTPSEVNALAKPLEIDGYAADLLVLTPPDNNPNSTGILVSLAAVDGVTWFFKMTGPQGSFTTLQPQLEQFLSTVDFNKTR